MNWRSWSSILVLHTGPRKRLWCMWRTSMENEESKGGWAHHLCVCCLILVLENDWPLFKIVVRVEGWAGSRRRVPEKVSEPSFVELCGDEPDLLVQSGGVGLGCCQNTSIIQDIRNDEIYLLPGWRGWWEGGWGGQCVEGRYGVGGWDRELGVVRWTTRWTAGARTGAPELLAHLDTLLNI